MGNKCSGTCVTLFSLSMIAQIDNHYELSDKEEVKEPIALRPRAQCELVQEQKAEHEKAKEEIEQK